MGTKGFCLTAATQAFSLTVKDARGIIRRFHAEMARGLAGRPGSLKMIPTFVGRPSGREKGTFIALDLGGTNFRVLALTLRGNGRATPPRVMKFALQKKHITGTGDDLFDFIAGCIETFLRAHRVGPSEKRGLGFTFSFPVRQTGVASGTLIHWSKDFRSTGVIGRDVVACLSRALAKRGLDSVAVAALANDTVGTLVAQSYRDRSCDVGVIIGTGTNACYPEKIRAIRTWKGAGRAGEMIINIEWGNFNKLARTSFDRALDRASGNPGAQILEKMVSGMYLGELTRLLLTDLSARGALPSSVGKALRRKWSFTTAYMSAIESDASPGLRATDTLLRGAGIVTASAEERALIRDTCRIVSRRAARIAAAAILAVVTHMDRRVSRRHTVALDGSVYEKHPTFARHMQAFYREYLGKRASRIRMVLTKDGSGKGAAIIAAVAYAGTDTAGR